MESIEKAFNLRRCVQEVATPQQDDEIITQLQQEVGNCTATPNAAAANVDDDVGILE